MSSSADRRISRFLRAAALFTVASGVGYSLGSNRLARGAATCNEARERVEQLEAEIRHGKRSLSLIANELAAAEMMLGRHPSPPRRDPARHPADWLHLRRSGWEPFLATKPTYDCLVCR